MTFSMKLSNAAICTASFITIIRRLKSLNMPFRTSLMSVQKPLQTTDLAIQLKSRVSLKRHCHIMKKLLPSIRR